MILVKPFDAPYDFTTGHRLHDMFGYIANKTYQTSKQELFSVVNRKCGNGVSDTHVVLRTVMEVFIIGILWHEHAHKAIRVDVTKYKYLKQIKKSLENGHSTKQSNQAYYQTRNTLLHPVTQHPLPAPELNMKNYCLLIGWLEASGEYHYEQDLLNQWKRYWKVDKTNFQADLEVILSESIVFLNRCENTLNNVFSNDFFNGEIEEGLFLREDFFQITKGKNEYYLNALVAIWMNQLNKDLFIKKTSKVIMAPGCMRINNGKCCKAQLDGDYLRCVQCSTGCNLGKLVKKGKKEAFGVRIVLHQSGFKVNNEFLKDKGVVGIACLSCLVSGGLMLASKGIHAQCLVINKPTCKRHWSLNGEMTSINTNGLKLILD